MLSNSATVLLSIQSNLLEHKIRQFAVTALPTTATVTLDKLKALFLQHKAGDPRTGEIVLGSAIQINDGEVATGPHEWPWY